MNRKAGGFVGGCNVWLQSPGGHEWGSSRSSSTYQACGRRRVWPGAATRHELKACGIRTLQTVKNGGPQGAPPWNTALQQPGPPWAFGGLQTERCCRQLAAPLAWVTSGSQPAAGCCRSHLRSSPTQCAGVMARRCTAGVWQCPPARSIQAGSRMPACLQGLVAAPHPGWCRCARMAGRKGWRARGACSGGPAPAPAARGKRRYGERALQLERLPQPRQAITHARRAAVRACKHAIADAAHTRRARGGRPTAGRGAPVSLALPEAALAGCGSASTHSWRRRRSRAPAIG